MQRRPIANRMWKRALFVLATGLSLAAAPRAFGGDVLVSRVTWTDADGVQHRGLFQGRADGSTLTGRVYQGRRRLAVTGTLGSGGRLSGSLHDDDGTVVGYFLGDVDNGGRLRGAWVTEGNEGTLDAPADCLAPRRRGTAPPAGCKADGGAP